MTDIAESTELQAFKRQKDGYKVNVKNFLMYLCCSTLRRTQSPAKVTPSDYEIYMVCLLVATVNWQIPTICKKI